MSTYDERLLVERHQAGDPAAFADIVCAHRERLLAHAYRRLHDQQAAEDAVQETLLRAYRALPRFNGQYHLAAWLHRICEHVCYDEGNRRRRDVLAVSKLLATGADVAVEDHPVEGALNAPTDVPDISAAIAALPDNYREALYLRYVDDLPYRDLATATGVTEENARARVSRARAALRRVLGTAVAALAFVLPWMKRSERVAAAAGPADPGVVPHATHTGSALAQLAFEASHLSFAAAPAVQAAAQQGSAITGKVAIAVGIVAAVAVPTAGVKIATDEPTPKPAPVAAAPADAGPADTPDRSSEPRAGRSGSTGPEAELLTSTSVLPEATTSTTTAQRAADEQDAEARAEEADEGSAPDGSGTVAPDGREPVPDAAGGLVTIPELTLADSGPRIDLEGRGQLDLGREVRDVRIAGKLFVADVADKDGVRRMDATLALTLADGTVIDARLVGTAAVTDHPDGTRSYNLAGRFRLSGVEGLELDPTGEFTAGLFRAGENGSFDLSLNGGPDSE